jgi:hypothetical protein
MILRSNVSENEVLREAPATRVRNGQRGGAKIRALIWTAILLFFVFVCFKVVPPYYSNYEFEDWLKTQVPFLMVNHTTDEGLTGVIIKELKNDGVTITKDNIKIIQNNSQGINVQITYDVHCDLMIYQLTLHFTPQMNSQALVQ